MMREAGVEPARPKTQDPKSCTAASYITRAYPATPHQAQERRTSKVLPPPLSTFNP